jgi:hypothetical protein
VESSGFGTFTNGGPIAENLIALDLEQRVRQLEQQTSNTNSQAQPKSTRHNGLIENQVPSSDIRYHGLGHTRSLLALVSPTPLCDCLC